MDTRTRLAAGAAALALVAAGAGVAQAELHQTREDHPEVSQGPRFGQVRIVGGTKATHAYPWMAVLSIIHTNGDSYQCGGTQISPDLVLTAAHCLERSKHGRPMLVQARLGSLQAESGGVLRNAAGWRTGAGPGKGDWAVVKLVEPHPSGQYVTLAKGSTLDKGPVFHAMGWGLTVEGGDPTDELREVDLPFISDATKACGGGKAEICAGNLDQGGVDTCQGDSGGPLLANPQAWVQVGIVSWGNGCGEAHEPGHYTQVSTYRSAILKAAKELGGTLPA